MKKNILLCIAIIVAVVALDAVTKGALLYLITGNVPVAGGGWGIVPVPFLMAHGTDWF